MKKGSRPDQATCDRRAFISRFMREGGLTYSQACRSYEVMCVTVADAIVNGNKVAIGRVGSIVPCWKPPRDVHMHFRRNGKEIETGVHRTYFLDGRYDYKFRLYRRFMETRALKWTADMPVRS